MKFKLFFILILILCVALCGCKTESLDPSDTTPATTVPTEPPAPKLGLLLKNLSADEQDGVSLESCLTQMGYEVLRRNAGNDQAKQNEQAAALLEEGCEVLILQPVMVSGLDVLLESMTHIPVIILDAQPELDDRFKNVTLLNIRDDNAGAAQATLLNTLPNGGDLNGDGTVSLILVNGPEDHKDATTRTAAFTAAIDPEKHIVLEAIAAQWDEDGGRSASAQMMNKYGPDVEVIVTFNEDMALGAITAVENGGWVPGQDVYVITIGTSSIIRNETQLGRISGLSAPDADARLLLLQQILKGEVTEKENFIDYVPVTP